MAQNVCQCETTVTFLKIQSHVDLFQFRKYLTQVICIFPRKIQMNNDIIRVYFPPFLPDFLEESLIPDFLKKKDGLFFGTNGILVYLYRPQCVIMIN